MKFKSLILATVLLATTLVAKDRLSIYFEAGAVGDSFSTVISNGAKAAAKDLDVDLKIYYSDWEPSKMVENFKNALATKPDGMVIMGHPGDELYAPLVEQAVKQGIVVTSVDTELLKTREEFASKGFGYVGSNNYESGKSMANEAIRVFGLKKGESVMIWGLLSQPIRGLRAKGMIEVFETNGIKVDYIEISPEINKDPSLGLSVFSAYVLKHPKTRLAIMDHGALTAQTPQFMKNLNLDKDKLNIAGFSLSPATVAGIKDGYIDLVGDAQPFVQGYLGVWQAVMSKKYAFSGFNIDTGGGFATKDNIKTIEPLIKNGIR
ncbi:substrate-binding domain-containing protein [Campylobacter geochelonis]|uniref:sugar ABC transporter substrate-binding protein n=1 Tax=Campylobacter geochelonis TaxID=1780362 RepID=UPI000770A84F|nr:substrate-binding domain-containing protein [Campylobacter geochelonis]CZE47206.1 ABC-type sugar transport system%2C periplasmic component [Campylobacter geochelonis]CZE49964.1 ABC-type sugar transport system%2C periplasmic component [Campylobacter geochelonis]